MWFFSPFRMKVKGRGITCLLASFSVMCLVASPGGKACPRRCACYVPTEVHCTFRYLTSIPDSISPDVERINLGCVGTLVLSPSQGDITLMLCAQRSNRTCDFRRWTKMVLTVFVFWHKYMKILSLWETISNIFLVNFYWEKVLEPEINLGRMGGPRVQKNFILATFFLEDSIC